MEIQKVTIKKGFYDSVEDIDIYIPSTAVWINEQSTEGRCHSGNFHYLGIVPYKEPFKKLVHQGMILGANGIVVNGDVNVVLKYTVIVVPISA
mgnify:CR=1 FL=1